MTELSEHRVSMLGASWRRFEDPTRSRDPRVRAVLASLAAVSAPPPRAEFRADLRAQLVAIAPRIIAESADATAAARDIRSRATNPAVAPASRSAAKARPRHSDSFVARLRGISLGRPLAIAASVLTAFAMLLGGAVYMSKKALPGDTLYGLKRASESLQLATASSDTEKAHDYLSFAATRAAEVRELLSRAGAIAAGPGPQAGGIDATTAKNVTSTLASADSDVRSASVLLGRQAVHSKSAKPLATVASWGPKQLTRLNNIAAALPAGSLRSRTEKSAALVSAAISRAAALAPVLGCSCLSSSGSDELGPLPCITCVAPAQLPTGISGTPSGGGPAPRVHPTPSASLPEPASNSPHNLPDPGLTDSPDGSQSPTGGLHLPTLPVDLPTKSLPVSVSSCGVGASLGPIIIGVGLCPVTLSISLHP